MLLYAYCMILNDAYIQDKQTDGQIDMMLAFHLLVLAVHGVLIKRDLKMWFDDSYTEYGIPSCMIPSLSWCRSPPSCSGSTWRPLSLYRPTSHCTSTPPAGSSTARCWSLCWKTTVSGSNGRQKWCVWDCWRAGGWQAGSPSRGWIVWPGPELTHPCHTIHVLKFVLVSEQGLWGLIIGCTTLQCCISVGCTNAQCMLCAVTPLFISSKPACSKSVPPTHVWLANEWSIQV